MRKRVRKESEKRVRKEREREKEYHESKEALLRM